MVREPYLNGASVIATISNPKQYNKRSCRLQTHLCQSRHDLYCYRVDKVPEQGLTMPSRRYPSTIHESWTIDHDLASFTSAGTVQRQRDPKIPTPTSLIYRFNTGLHQSRSAGAKRRAYRQLYLQRRSRAGSETDLSLIHI